MKIFDQMIKEAEGVLVAYRDDLEVHDKKYLGKAKPGENYIWVLRSAGTHLFPIEMKSTVMSNHWARAVRSNKDATPFYVEITEMVDGEAHGTVKQVTWENAAEIYGRCEFGKKFCV